MKLIRRRLGDLSLAAALAVLGVVSAVMNDQGTGVDRPVDARALVFAAGTGAVLAVRRRWPLGTLAATTLLTATYLLSGYPYGLILVTLSVGVYTAARHLPLTTSAPACAVALVVLLTHIFTHPAALPGFVGLIPGSAFVIVPFAIGVAVRQNRESVAKARMEMIREHVYDERLRIAQEVHDVVGHGLAAIKMQADIALHLLAKKPEQAEIALTAISRTSTDALAELRGTLALIRRTGPEPAGLEAPGLNRLEDLRRRMGEAGLDVRIETTGQARELPVAVGLAGYRVVQESLTNVLRHSQARVATVRVDYQDDAVAITISNPVSRVPDRTEGLGIPGMRERVTALGGELTAGPTGRGTFVVLARIPLGGQG